MFCFKCGEAIPDGSKFCPKCGASLEENNEQFVVYASQEKEDVSLNENKKSTALLKKIMIVLGIAVIIIVVILVINESRKASLRNKLNQKWYESSGSILKVLEFSEDEIEYRLETGYSWLDTSVGTYEYKVVGSNKIKVERVDEIFETYTIEFNDEGTVMTITPSFTNTDKSEKWYELND